MAGIVKGKNNRIEVLLSLKEECNFLKEKLRTADSVKPIIKMPPKPSEFCEIW